MPQLSHDILRAASKNERRYITRHALDFYRALTMSGLYMLKSSDTKPFDTTIPESFFPALKWCIAAHPILSTTIKGQDTEEPVFVKPKTELDLRRHIRIVHPDDGVDEIEALRRVLIKTHDEAFTDVESVPPWKIVVVPLLNQNQDQDRSAESRVYIIFAYSHSVGDGRSGLIFHRTLLEGLRVGQGVHDCSAHYTASDPYQLPPSLEDACTLRITWSYLLLTLFGAYLPAFVSRWFDFQTPAVTEGTWTGEVMQYPEHPDEFRTGASILIVSNERTTAVLNTCRAKKGAKFTGLLNQLIVRALGSALPTSTTVDNFIGQIVVDLRGLVPSYSDDMMVNCVSAVAEASPRFQQDIDLKSDDVFWAAVRKTTERLARSSQTLVDQPVGLLRYLDKLRPWFLEKLGQRRDSSYEISNAVVFDPLPAVTPEIDSNTGEGADRATDWVIERMVMSQPANVTNCPLSFSVVTRKGGDMALTANWQVGVLGVEDEGVFVKDVLRRIDGDLTVIAGGMQG